MAKRAPAFIFAFAISFGIVSCNRPWILSSTATGAVFVGSRPEGEVVKATVRSSRPPSWVLVSLTPESPDGGAFPLEPPIAVRVEPSSLAFEPWSLDTTTVQRRVTRSFEGMSCNPCSVDIEIVLARQTDGGAPPIGVRWSLFAGISGAEEEAPAGENVTILPR